MSSSSTDSESRYALVSSFYGPGATIGWYLTSLACILSYSLHPVKRRHDTITADLVAVLTFPIVAAAHLIIQVQNYHSSLEATAISPTFMQKAASIEAALTVTEAFLPTQDILFVLATYFGCMKRFYLLALAGIFCFSAECFLLFFQSGMVMEAIEADLQRSFLVHFEKVLVCTMILLGISNVIHWGIISFFFVMRPQSEPFRSHTSLHQAIAEGMISQQESQKLSFKESKNATALKWQMLFIFPFSFSVWMLGVASNCSAVPFDSLWSWLRTVVSRVVFDLIPRSNTKIQELDQAVALFSGACALGFSLYSIADAHFQAWLARKKSGIGVPEEEYNLDVQNHSSRTSRA